MVYKEVKNIYLDIVLNKKLQKYFIISAIVFFVFSIIGYIYSYNNQEVSSLFFKALAEKYSFTKDFSYSQMFWFIFKNNLSIAFAVFIGGLFFALPTFLILVINSFVIGLVVQIGGIDMSLGAIIFSLLPHGVFEITAIFLALALGFILGNGIFLYLFKKREFKNIWIFCVKAFIFLVAPLLFFAALIESALILFFS